MILMHPITAANATATNAENDNAFGEKKLFLENNIPFINSISKINGAQIDSAEDLDVARPMYNLLEYSKNYRKTTGSLWANDYRGEPNFIEGSVTQDDLRKNDIKIVVPLKHLGNFCRNLNIPLINCEIELILTWFKNCVLISKTTREANYATNPVVCKINITENAIFPMVDTKLYTPLLLCQKKMT